MHSRKSLSASGAAAEKVQADTDAKKPLVAYYSRTGNARMVATALATHLDAEIEEIPSEKDRGIFTIIGEQYFWGDDKQKPFEKNLQDYSPIIVVAPIYLMKLSAPGRFFIEEVIPEGSRCMSLQRPVAPWQVLRKKALRSWLLTAALLQKEYTDSRPGRRRKSMITLTLRFS